MNPTVPLGIGNLEVDLDDHIAFFWETEEEFRRGAGVLVLGLRRGDKCVAFGHAEANRRLLDILRAEGFNPEDLVKQGRLSVIGGQPSWQAMLDEIARAFGEATSNGYACIRVLGNIGWEKMGWPSHEDILVFEAHVTQAAQPFPAWSSACTRWANCLRGPSITAALKRTEPGPVAMRTGRGGPI